MTIKKLLFVAAALLIGGGSVQAETDYTSSMPSAWTNSNGDFQGGRERYQGGSDYDAGKIIYQSFTAPAAGIYEIKFYAVTSSTSGRGWTNVFGDNIAQAYATAGSNKTTVAMTVVDQTGCTLIAEANIRTLSIEAAAGETIEYGIENIKTGGNWYTIKGLSAKMKSVAEIFQSQYDEAYAIWQYSTENEVGAKATYKTYVDAMNTALTGTLAEAQTASDNLAAALVTYEGKSYPIKGNGVKYDFTSKMNMAINAWTCKQGNGPAQYSFTGATETYGDTKAGEVMYQTISGLANGEYEIHFYAVANAANGGGTEGSGLTYVYANDQVLDIDVIKQNACTPSDYERTFTVMVNDGTLKYGITNNAVAGNWNICKNVSLYMTGAPDLSDYYDAIASKLTTANGLKSSPMKSTILDALQAAIDATSGYEDITIIGTLETMSADLTTAINNANTSVANYSDANTILTASSTLDATGQAAYAANETVSAIQSAYDARTLESVTSEQATSCAAALLAATKAQTADNSDWTNVIVNPSFENGFTGWTNSGMSNQGNNAFEKTGAKYAESWEPNGTKSLSQELTDLPAGTYRVSVDVKARGLITAKLYADDEEKNITIADATNSASIEFILESDGNVTFGIEGVGNKAGASWFALDNFTLTCIHRGEPSVANYKTVLNNNIEYANSIISARRNVGTGVFQIPESAITTLTTAKTTAQGVYDDADAVASEVTTAITNIKEALTDYDNTELNAPAAGTRYYLNINDDGQAWNGNAITFIANARGDDGNFNMQYLAKANPYLCQALKFTAVEGEVNTYKISAVRADGGEQYLTTKLLGYGNGSHGQLRTTNDVEKAAPVKIYATATDGQFQLLNVLAENAVIARNASTPDNGVYTDGTSTFTIAEATQASAILKANAGKFGTFIAPFAVTIPAGIEAYKVTAVTDGKLTLEAVSTTIPANTAVVVKNTSGSDYNETKQGWGTAKADSYVTELLTGVYTAATIPVGEGTTTNYVLQTDGDTQAFYVVDAAFTATPNRCYLTVTTGGGAKARVLYFDEATAIENLTPALSESEGVIYNLNGQRVNTLQKGINIVNGKKVLVK